MFQFTCHDKRLNRNIIRIFAAQKIHHNRIIMKITQEQTGELTATINLTLEPSDYAEKVKSVLKDYQKKANLPGFRPGKVPFGMVKKMYGKAVMVDEVNKLVSESLNHYIQEEKIKILGNPLPNLEKTKTIDFDTEGDYNFFFDIGISPEINIELDENIKVDYFDIQADDKTVKKFIKDIQMRQGQPQPVELSEEEDILRGEITDVQSEEGSEPKTTTIAVNFLKKKSEKSKFIGVKVGDVITFNPLKATENETEASHMLGVGKDEKDLLDRDYNFKVTEVSRVKPSELNEEFFNQVFPGSELKTKEDFEKKVEEEAIKDFAKESDKKFMNDFIDKIVNDAKLSLPDEFLKKWMLESNEGKITQDEIDKEYDNYAKAMKWQLIENKIINDQEIKVEEKDVRDYVKQYFLGRVSMPGDDPEADKRIEAVVDSVLQNQEEVQRIYETLLHDKVKDKVKGKIKLKNKKITYDDFVKLVNKN